MKKISRRRINYLFNQLQEGIMKDQIHSFQLMKGKLLTKKERQSNNVATTKAYLSILDEPTEKHYYQNLLQRQEQALKITLTELQRIENHLTTLTNNTPTPKKVSASTT